MMMVLSQDEIDSLLSAISATPISNPSNAVLSEGGAVISHQAPSTYGSLESNQDHGAHRSILEIVNAEKDKKYKIYNFRRPDKFSKDQLRALETIHESFARNTGMLLTSFLRTNVQVDVVSVDQLTYSELVGSMPRPISVGIIEGPPFTGQMLLGISHEVTMCIIDRMLGGGGKNGNNQIKPRELSDIESNMMQKTFTKILKNLNESWKGIAPVKYELKALEESYHLIQITPPGEIVAAVTLEVTIGNQDSGLISLCYPYPMLEKVIESLSSSHLFSTKDKEEDEEGPTFEDELLEKMYYAPIPVSVLIGGTAMSVGQVRELRVGDVIRLDRLAGSDLLLCINHKPKFFCQPGTLRQNMAVCIQNKVPEPQALKGFALDSARGAAFKGDIPVVNL
ncbi:MAG: flagellar motor switch protein FliM [Vampirovibrio sp.]